MQINLNNTFNKFSIRKYVAEIRIRDPKNCYLFGSLGASRRSDLFASYQPAKSTFWSTQNFPVVINDSDDTTPTYMIESLKTNNNMGKVITNGSSGLTSSKVNNGQHRHNNSVTKGLKFGDNKIAYDNKGRKIRLLSELIRNAPAKFGPLRDITNHVSFNSKSVTETEDDSNDDITLNELVRKQKGVKGSGSKLKKKKRKKSQIKEPRVDQDKKSKHGPVVRRPKVQPRKRRIADIDTQIITKRRKEINRTEATEAVDEDSEMEAVMLLASRFNKSSSVYADTNKTVAKETVQKKDQLQGTTANVFEGGLKKCENLVCSVNRNPADFSIPNDENEFMRGV